MAANLALRLLIVVLGAAAVSSMHPSTSDQDYYFNYYVFAQQWPAAFCFDDSSSGVPRGDRYRYAKQECHFPSNITSWTNHGLWPSVNETYPNFCNSSWPLMEQPIADLEDSMRAHWPSFAGSDFPFWSHEWTKHGTCAEKIDALAGPHKYFSYALALNAKYDIETLLASHLILPGTNRCYQASEMKSVINKIFGESVILGCTWDKNARKQFLAQVEICFDKQFELKCDPSLRKMAKPRMYTGPQYYKMPEVEMCRDNELICYYPIEH